MQKTDAGIMRGRYRHNRTPGTTSSMAVSGATSDYAPAFPMEYGPNGIAFYGKERAASIAGKTSYVRECNNSKLDSTLRMRGATLGII